MGLFKTATGANFVAGKAGVMLYETAEYVPRLVRLWWSEGAKRAYVGALAQPVPQEVAMIAVAWGSFHLMTESIMHSKRPSGSATPRAFGRVNAIAFRRLTTMQQRAWEQLARDVWNDPVCDTSAQPWWWTGTWLGDTAPQYLIDLANELRRGV